MKYKSEIINMENNETGLNRQTYKYMPEQMRDRIKKGVSI